MLDLGDRLLALDSARRSELLLRSHSFLPCGFYDTIILFERSTDAATELSYLKVLRQSEIDNRRDDPGAVHPVDLQ